MTAYPFTHWVIDGSYSDALIDLACAIFPSSRDARWHTFDAPNERGKQQLDGMAALEFPVVSDLLGEMTSDAFVKQVGALVGIGDLIPDYTGGGMHQTLRGGWLGMHTDSTSDFNDRGLYRRVNVLLYLNRYWRPTHGGELRLDTGPNTEYVEIAPLANRLVIFETTPTTFHGHPKPWRGPRPRRSLACYYYTERAPDGFTEHQETTFRG